MMLDLLMSDTLFLGVFTIGAGVYASVAIILAGYKSERENSRHIMASVGFVFLSLHHAILALRVFRYWLTITQVIVLSRLAIIFMLLFAILGVISHLRYRRRVRNE